MSATPSSYSNKTWGQQTWSERLTFTSDKKTISQVLIPRLRKIQYAKIAGVSLLALALLGFFIWAAVTGLPLAIFSALSLEMLAAYGILLTPFIIALFIILFIVFFNEVQWLDELFFALLPLVCLSTLMMLPTFGVLVAGSNLFTACILLVSAAVLSFYFCYLMNEHFSAVLKWLGLSGVEKHINTVLKWLGLSRMESFLLIIFITFNIILLPLLPYLSFAVTSIMIGCSVLLASLLILGISLRKIFFYYDKYKNRSGIRTITGMKALLACLCFFGLLSFILWAAITNAVPLAIFSGLTLEMLAAFAVIAGSPLAILVFFLLKEQLAKLIRFLSLPNEYELIVPLVIVAACSSSLLVCIPACSWLIAGSSFGTACVLLLAALALTVSLICVFFIVTPNYKFRNFLAWLGCHNTVYSLVSVILCSGFLLFNLAILPSLIFLPAPVSHIILGCCVLNGVLLLLAIAGIKILKYSEHIILCKRIKRDLGASEDGTLLQRTIDRYLGSTFTFLLDSGANPNAVDAQGKYLLRPQLLTTTSKEKWATNNNPFNLQLLIQRLEEYGFDIWHPDNKNRPFISDLAQAWTNSQTNLTSHYTFFMNYWQETNAAKSSSWRRPVFQLSRWVENKLLILRHLITEFASVLTPEAFTRLALNPQEFQQLFTVIDPSTKQSLADDLINAVDNNQNFQSDDPQLCIFTTLYKNKVGKILKENLDPYIGNKDLLDLIASYAVFYAKKEASEAIQGCSATDDEPRLDF